MADVTVDEKPMAKLPIDPDSIPDAVKKRAAAVDALYNKKGQLASAQQESGDVVPKPPASGPKPEQPSASPEAPASQAPAPAAQATPPAEPAPAESAPAPPPPPEDENSQTWKDRFLGMQGRYHGAQKTLGEMQEQLTQLGNELLQTQQTVYRNGRTAPSPPPPPQAYVTEQDVQNYGSDLVNFTQRAAAQALAPKLQEIEQQNAELQRRLALEARHRLDAEVAADVPNYRDIDRDPRWHNWLRSVDMLSGRVRQQLLNEAIASASAPRVISFFRGFLQEEAATGHIEPTTPIPQATPPREPAINLVSYAAPGRARPATGGDASVPPDKPTYTRAQIAQLYSQHRKGAYVGREAEWARQETDIIAAGREGRIR
jgi:hypothetical protein